MLVSAQMPSESVILLIWSSTLNVPVLSSPEVPLLSEPSLAPLHQQELTFSFQDPCIPALARLLFYPQAFKAHQRSLL